MPRYVYDVPVEFRLKEKVFALSNDNFSIKRVDTGKSVFKVKGNVFSMRDSKKMYSRDGKTLFKMTEAFISMRSKMFIQDSRNGAKYSIRKKGIIPLLGTSTIYVWNRNKSSRKPWLKIKGDLLRKRFKIKEVATGRKVASVRRKGMNFNHLVMDKQTYFVRVEPGQDAALMVFLAVAIDENYHEEEED